MRVLSGICISLTMLLSIGCTNVNPSVAPLTLASFKTVIETTNPVNLANQSAYTLTGRCRIGSEQVVVTFTDNLNNEISATVPCVNRRFSTTVDLSSFLEGSINIVAASEFAEGDVLPTFKDITPPIITGAVSDGQFFNSLTRTANLLYAPASDSTGVGVERYEIAVGTAAGLTNVLPWTSVRNVTAASYQGVSLAEGTAYFPQVRAVDFAGNVSAAIAGDGWIPDVSPPMAIAMFNDMNFGSSVEAPQMEWSASSDLGSGLAGYELALGTLPGLTDIRGWTPVGVVEKANMTGLTLNNGQIYYPSLRAVDQAGNTSPIATSNGFRAVTVWRPQLGTNYSNFIGSGRALKFFDDNIKIGGEDFRLGGTVSRHLIKLLPSGSVDSTFSIGSGFNDEIHSLAVQPDGKILVTGKFTSYNSFPVRYIVRLNSDGSVDSTFNSGTSFSNWPFGISVQDDGKIWVTGFFSSYNGVTSRGVARLNSDGSIDTPTFLMNAFSLAEVGSVIEQPDGRFLITGSFTDYNSIPANRIVRLLSDGSIDSTFFTGSGFDNTVGARRLGDGSYFVSGTFTTYNGTPTNGLLKLNSDGTIDSSFNIGTGFNNSVRGLEVLSDGRILVVGDFTTFNGASAVRMVRLNPDGSRDNSFNVGSGPNNSVIVNARSDGSYIIGGTFTTFNGNSRNYFARLNNDGSLDATFSVGTGFDRGVEGIFGTPDGGMFVKGGFTSYQGTVASNILDLNSDGSVNSSFNPGAGPTGANNTVTGIFRRSDGLALVYGSFVGFNGSTVNRVVALEPSGARSSAMNFGTGFSDNIRDIAEQSDGRLLLGGRFSFYNGASSPRLVRLNPDGSRDTSFNISLGFDDAVEAVQILSDGRIIVGGSFLNFNGAPAGRIVILNSDGSLDGSLLLGVGFDGTVQDIKIDPMGRIIVAGSFTSLNGNPVGRLVRILSNGTVDPEFNGSTVAFSPNKILLQSDGKILVSGSSLVRLNSDGSVDTTFNTGTGFDNQLYDFDISNNGLIGAVGIFDFYNGFPVYSFVTLGW